MRWWLLLLGLIFFQACKTGAGSGKQMPENLNAKSPVLSAVIDGNFWAAENVTANRLGDLLIIKGTDAKGRVLSLTLPPFRGMLSVLIGNGGKAAVTWSVSRKEGFSFAAPYQGYKDNGVIGISVNQDNYVAGTFETTVSNGGKVITIEKGQFSVNY